MCVQCVKSRTHVSKVGHYIGVFNRLINYESMVSLVARCYTRFVNGIKTFSGLFVRISTFT